MRRVAPILLFTLLCAAAGLSQQAPRPDGEVAALAKARNTETRGAAIIKRLNELGIKCYSQTFTHNGKIGFNIFAELPGNARQRLLLGAHYDRVAIGQGAVDNASGVAAVLHLLERFKAAPLKNYAVSAAFFDLHEAGSFGAIEYLAGQKKETLPAMFVNFDVFGYGDTLWVMAMDEKSASAKAVTEAASSSGFPAHLGTAYPMTDHLVFTEAQIETLSFSLLPGEEINRFVAMLKASPEAQERLEKPKVLTIIHSSEDTLDKVDAKAALRAAGVVESAIRVLDAKR
jgi:aminopeptidase S